MKIKPTYETEVYISKAGYAVILQSDSQNVIGLSPEQIPFVVAELQRLLATSGEWWDPLDDDEAQG